MTRFAPGSMVPVTGRYELYHGFGFRTGLVVNCMAGQTLPSSPKGSSWMFCSGAVRDIGDGSDRIDALSSRQVHRAIGER